MRHSEFTALFRTAAQQHKEIRHSETNPAFYRIISSGPPYDGLFAEEFRQSLKTLKLQYDHCLILETYTQDYHDSMSMNIQKEYNSCFYVLGRIEKAGDFAAMEALLDKTELIAEDILSYWKQAMEDTQYRDRIHKFNATGGEKIGPIDLKYFGTKIYFSFTKSANLQLQYNPAKWL